MAKTRQPRRSRSQWQEIINDQIESGMEMESYCHAHKIPIDGFRKWRRILNPSQSITPKDRFIEIPLHKSVERQDDAIGKRIELDLGNGMTLRVFS